MIIAGGYFYLRYSYLKVPSYKPDNAKVATPLDLRPSLIAKLQQLVEDGSNGLYRLSIGQITPDLIASTLEITDATLTPDYNSLERLDKNRQAPDDVFKIKVHRIKITGIGITDLLHKDRIDVKNIVINSPDIEVFHKLKFYNESSRIKNDTISIYHRIEKIMKSVSIATVDINNGKVTDHNESQKNTTKVFNHIDIGIKSILIDSSTQFDNNRFFFAKVADISCKDYAITTPDSLYDFKIGRILVSGEKHTMSALDVSLKPHGGRSEFQKHLHFRKEMFTATFPKVSLTGNDWWSLMHRDRLIASNANVEGGSFLIYLDKTLSSTPTIKKANFPDQVLMKLPMPVSIARMKVNDVTLNYEEYDPKIERSGVATFSKTNVLITNVTNMRSKIKANSKTLLTGKTMFMSSVPMNAKIEFDLAHVNEGAFSASVHVDQTTNDILNPICEPMALFTLRTGTLKEGTAHVTGNNEGAACDVSILYNDLRITPFKDKVDKNGNLKKKGLTSAIANTFIIKKNNPGENSEIRQPRYTTQRDHHGNFFNFVWTSILTGILKTVGIPVKFGVKKA